MKKLVIALLLSSGVCFADGIPHLYIMHMNGIGTTESEAKENMRILNKNLPPNLLKSNVITVDYVYNPTGSDYDKTFWDNLADVAHQKSKEGQLDLTLDDYTKFWITENHLDPQEYAESTQKYQDLKATILTKYEDKMKDSAGVNFEDIVNNFHGVVPPEFAGVVNLLKTPYKPNPLYANQLNQFTDDSNTHHIANPKEDAKQADDLQNAVDNYIKLHPKLQSNQDYRNTKNLVLFVPHSQGNIYTNWLYKFLVQDEHYPEKQMAIYGVASPAKENVGDWIARALSNDASIRSAWGEINSYLTSSKDLVIKFANIFPDKVLDPNMTLPFYTADWMGHSFIDIYLSDTGSQKQIIKMITLEAMELVKTMNSNLSHFDLAMYSYIYPTNMFKANSSIRQGNDNPVCDGTLGACFNEVLNFPTLRSDYSLNRTDLYFPQSKFGKSEYTFLRPRLLWNDGFGTGLNTQVITPVTTRIVKHIISCGGYGNCSDLSTGFNDTKFMTGYAIGYDGLDFSAMYSKYKLYYESDDIGNDLLVAARFTLP